MALPLPAQQTLLGAERPRLEALARRLVFDAEDARDLVQSALEIALSRWHTLRDEQSADAWLRRIVVHQAISQLRRRKLYRSFAALLLVEPVAVAPAPDQQLEQKRHLQALATALEFLPARQSAAFSLRYLEGLSLDETADALGVGRGTARVHLQRAVKKLRSQGLLDGGTDEHV